MYKGAVMDQDVYQRLLDGSFHFLSFRARSEKEVRDFLYKKLSKRHIVDTSIVEKIIDRLRELKFLDDTAFATWYIQSRQRSKPMGKTRLLFELSQKGIAKTLAVELLAQEQTTDTEKDLAIALIAKKQPLLRHYPELEQKKKLFSLLMRRGFSSSNATRFIDEAYKKE